MKKGEVSAKANLTREGQLEFLLDLYEKEVPLSKEDINLLIRHKMIKPVLADRPKSEGVSREAAALNKKTDLQNEADKRVDVVDDMPFAEEGKRHVFMDDETYDNLSKSSLFTYQGGKEIFKSDWMPEDKIYHKEDFVNWINSINSGFQTMTRYKKFSMYCQQAKDWLDDTTSMASFDNLRDVKKTHYTSWISIST
jgi:hypothetical protein